jgi:hypothetical protein
MRRRSVQVAEAPLIVRRIEMQRPASFQLLRDGDEPVSRLVYTGRKEVGFFGTQSEGPET